ncbi:MAG: ISNCY family transposase [Bacteroidales bacterium]|nr:ISNCY family transposase [Bacteroidales bacterium]
MLREKYEQVNLFETLLPFDITELDPELQRINDFLDAHPQVLSCFTEQALARSENSKTLGRPSESIESIFRMLIIRRRYLLGFRETSKMVNDSLTLRYFTRVYYESVPTYSTLCRYDNLLSDDVLKQINDHIVQGAKKQKVTSGRKMRVDSTAVEADIHYPTDSGLLNDCIKVVSRLAKKCKELGLATGEKTRDFTRSAKKQVLHIIKYARKRSEEGKDEFKNTYSKLINIAKRCASNATRLVESIPEKSIGKAKIIRKRLEQIIPVTQQVIDQATRRVLKGEKLSSDEKIVSIFQSDIYTIRKGKRDKENEFGKLLEIQQSDGKIITHWTTHSSNVSDTERFIPAVEKHIKTFGRPPNLAAGDRGYSSEDNEKDAQLLGVKRVCLPKRGKKTKERIKYEKQRWFKAAQRFRAGIEGTISVLKRRYGLNRCLNRGDNAFDRWNGLAIIAYNLVTIANA